MKTKPPSISKTLSTFLTFFLLIQLISGVFLFVPKPQEARAATTRYVDATACAGTCSNGSTNYDPATRTCGSGTATVYSTLENMNSGATTGDTILVRGDTYTISASLTISKVFDLGAYSGETPVINTGSSYTITLSGNGSKFHGFNFTGYALTIGANNCEVYNNYFYNAIRSVQVRKGTNNLIHHNRFAGTGYVSGYATFVLRADQGSTSGSFYDNIIAPYFASDGAAVYNHRAIFIWNPASSYTQTWNIYNNYITGCLYEAVYSQDENANSTYLFKNNIIGIGGVQYGTYYTIYVSNANPTFTLINNYLTPNVGNTAVAASDLPYTVNVDTETNNLYVVDKTNPSTASVGSAGIQALGPNYGIFTFGIDDVVDTTISQTANLLDVWRDHGFHGTAFVEGYRISSIYPQLTALLQDGHEVQSHTYSHTSADTTNAFTASYSGADTAQKVTVASNSITFQTSGSDTYVFSYSAATMLSDLIADSTLAAKHWTITSGNANSLASTPLLLTSLTLGDFAYTGGKSTITLDRTGISQGFFKDELVTWVAELEAQTSQAAGAVSTVAFPYTVPNTGYAAAMKAAGYIGGRGSGSSYPRNSLGAITVYDTFTASHTHFNGDDYTASETEVKARTEMVCDWMRQNGFLVNFYTHTNTQTSLAQLGWIAEVMQDCSGVSVLPFKQALQTIRQSPWNDSGTGADATAGDDIWSRYFSTSWDYSLKSTSPLIDAGVDVGLTTDFSGNHIYGTPDIGGFEYQPPYTIGTDNVNISAPIRIYADGKYRYTAATSGTTTANLSITPSGGWGTGDYSQWMDASIDTWNTTSTYYKKWTEEAASSTITTDHTIGDLQPNQYYHVKVDDVVLETLQANGSGQISFTYSGGYSTKTFEVEEIAAPTIGAPTPLSSSAIRWNFTDNADNETGFRVYTNADAIATSSATANLSYLTETGLSENTQYIRYVKAYNSYGESASSSVTSTYTLINAPSGLSFDTIGTSSITMSASGTLSNLASNTSGVYFNETSGNSGSSDSSWQQTTSYQDTGLSENTQYTYRVKARNGDGTATSYTATSSRYTLADTPTGLTTANIADQSITVSVDVLPNATSGSSGYYFSQGSHNSGWIQTNSWQDTGLACGASYTYNVKYRNGDSTETATTSQSFSTNPCAVSAIAAGAVLISPQISQQTIPQQTNATQSQQPTQSTSNFISTIPTAFSFQTNFKQGKVGLSVEYLQIILNQDPDTQVSQIGVGSLGKETNYFGQKTKQAVIRFQEKYANEILKPWGFTEGTGIVGKTTRAKLNELLGKQNNYYLCPFKTKAQQAIVGFLITQYPSEIHRFSSRTPEPHNPNQRST